MLTWHAVLELSWLISSKGRFTRQGNQVTDLMMGKCGILLSEMVKYMQQRIMECILPTFQIRDFHILETGTWSVCFPILWQNTLYCHSQVMYSMQIFQILFQEAIRYMR